MSITLRVQILNIDKEILIRTVVKVMRILTIYICLRYFLWLIMLCVSVRSLFCSMYIPLVVKYL